MVRHTRIRPFNTRVTYPEQNLDNDLCQAVVAAGVVYLRGQIGQDLDTRESVGIGDVEAQADRAMGRWLAGVYPVSTGIVVSALARPEWLVEIDATAVISEGEGRFVEAPGAGGTAAAAGGGAR